jgi:hypothetical protein
LISSSTNLRASASVGPSCASTDCATR